MDEHPNPDLPAEPLPVLPADYQPPTRVRQEPWTAVAAVEVVLHSGRGVWLSDDPDVRSVIGVSGRATFTELAWRIQVAYGLRDTSHLHRFVLPAENPRPTAEPAMWGNRNGGDRLVLCHAGEASELDYQPQVPGSAALRRHLPVGRRFFYVFDYGDQWKFMCRLVPLMGTVPAKVSTWFIGLPRYEFAQYGFEFSDPDAPETEEQPMQFARPRVASQGEPPCSTDSTRAC